MTYASRLFALALAGAAVAISPSASNASVVFYSSQASFAAAAPGAVDISFSGLGVVQPYTHANPLTFSGVTITSAHPGLDSTALIVFDNSVGDNWFGDTLVLTFGPNVTAEGDDIFNQIGEPGSAPISAPITEAVYSGAALLGERTLTEASGFFGVTSTTPISRITFFSDCDSDCSTFVNTISIASTAAVPEPSAWLLMLSGFAGVGLALRRLRTPTSLSAV